MRGATILAMTVVFVLTFGLLLFWVVTSRVTGRVKRMLDDRTTAWECTVPELNAVREEVRTASHTMRECAVRSRQCPRKRPT